MLKSKKIIALLVITLIAIVNITYFTYAYSYSGYKWSVNGVSYCFDSTVPSSWRTAIDNGAATWNYAGAKFSFYCDSSSSNYVCLDDLGGVIGYIALATRYAYSSGIIYRMNIRFNKSMYFDVNGASTAFDVRTIATHEFGHWLALDDLYDSISKSQRCVMYGYFSRGEIRTSLTSDVF